MNAIKQENRIIIFLLEILFINSLKCRKLNLFIKNSGEINNAINTGIEAILKNSNINIRKLRKAKILILDKSFFSRMWLNFFIILIKFKI